MMLGSFFASFLPQASHKPLMSSLKVPKSDEMPKGFLQSLTGKHVAVKLKWGMEYRGACGRRRRGGVGFTLGGCGRVGQEGKEALRLLPLLACCWDQLCSMHLTGQLTVSLAGAYIFTLSAD